MSKRVRNSDGRGSRSRVSGAARARLAYLRTPDGKRLIGRVLAGPIRVIVALAAVIAYILRAIGRFGVAIWRFTGALDAVLWQGIARGASGLWSIIWSSFAFFLDSLIELVKWLPSRAGRAYCAGAAAVGTIFGLWVMDEVRRASAQTAVPELIVLPPEDPDNPIVARVAGRFVRMNEVRQAFAAANPEAERLTLQAAFDRGVIETFVEQRLLVRAALEGGIARQQDVTARINAARERILASAYMKSRIDAATAPERVRQLYDSQSDLVKLGDEVRARHIVVPTREEAEIILLALQSGTEFATLALAHSIDPSTRDKGGEIGYFTRHMMTPVFTNAAFTTGVGNYAPLFTSQFGWHILQVLDRRPAREVSFEMVEERIREFLRQQEIDATLRELSRTSEIIYFQPEGKDTVSRVLVPTAVEAARTDELMVHE